MTDAQALAALQEVLKRPVAYHRIFAKIGGGATAGLLLSQAFYWTPRGDEGWFYKSMQEWEEETGLTRTEQETARERLTKRGLLEEKRSGMPARLYFRINIQRLFTLIAENLQPSMQESRRQEAAEPANMIAEKPQSTIKDTETTAETTPEKKPMAAAAAPQAGKKQSKASKVSNADPRSKHPAIQLVRSILGHYPKQLLYDKIIQTLGTHPDGPRAVECATECAARSWNVENLNTWLFDWYANGIPERNGNGNGQHAQPARTNADKIRDNLRRFGVDVAPQPARTDSHGVPRGDAIQPTGRR